MERLLTKCCRAKRIAEKDDVGWVLRILCESCEAVDPPIDWFEVNDDGSTESTQAKPVAE